MRYFLEISYKGTNYNGWQRQPNAPSVQQTIEDALSLITQSEITVTGAGRTDTGVHARYYICHFDIESIEDSSKVCYQLNAILPDDIAVKRITQVADNVHARFDALRREYKYYVLSEKDPFAKEQAWLYYVDLDMDRMNRAASILFGQKDFATFSKLHSNNKTTICTIYKAKWAKCCGGVVFTISADRFLRNMVRSIVGTLVDVGRGKVSIEEFYDILESCDRSRSSGSAPAQGLFLTDVVYSEDVFIKTNFINL